jgi:hypothetical protein
VITKDITAAPNSSGVMNLISVAAHSNAEQLRCLVCELCNAMLPVPDCDTMCECY